MKAVLYIRVSTDEQAREGFSIEAQKAFLMRKASEQDLLVVKEYVDDGYSAKDIKRPALQQILKDVEQREFDVVLFWRLDRFTRKSKDFHRLTEELGKYNVGIRSATEPIDTTSAIGRFQLELSVSLAQLERETTSERVSFVMEERSRKGMRNGAPAPLGYTLDGQNLIVDKEKVALIKRIFNMYLDGNGFKGIAYALNREGIPGSNKALWSGPGIQYMLENPVYIGKIRYNYIDKTNKKTNKAVVAEGTHEPIIDDVLFYRVQHEIANRKKGGKKITSAFIFSSVLRCGRCGGSMHGNSYEKDGKRYKTYRCSKKYDHGMCDAPYMRESGITQAFLDVLILDEHELDKFFAFDKVKTDEKAKIAELERELEQIAKRKKRWQLAFANELISLEELKTYTEEDKLQETELRKQYEQYGKGEVSVTKEEILAMFKELRTSWHLIDNDKAKKMFINATFDFISIDVAENGARGRGTKPKFVVTDMRFKSL